MSLERFVKIESNGVTGELKIINPATGEVIPGVCNVTIRTRDKNGDSLPVPVATVELYARVDVVAALEVLPLEWPLDDDQKAQSE